MYALSDCKNWATNRLGNCGGRVEWVESVKEPVCENCRNRPAGERDERSHHYQVRIPTGNSTSRLIWDGEMKDEALYVRDEYSNRMQVTAYVLDEEWSSLNTDGPISVSRIR